ncbi:MAG: SpoIID/LytB domain-containing protein, partial [Dysgonamonadaceae bacterium]|nr:SpoIID/LytB domain-containing protein [Dysgonamonadaceae bacterium]
MNEPVIRVGILSAAHIQFRLFGAYRLNDEVLPEGDYSAGFSKGKILFRHEEYDELLLEAEDFRSGSFELKDVLIGINFHWERKENQRFQGNLKLIVEGDSLRAINLVLLEDYLTSVISSEMSATSSGELLKAHAVISRSWLLAQIQKSKSLEGRGQKYRTFFQSPTEIIRWYDREDHERFDVCADDHCQRYQGITRASTPLVKKVTAETRGEVLMWGDAICDARFSKCCGGAMETFENTWEAVPHPYLVSKADSLRPVSALPDLSVEAEADRWIRTSPEAFCNTSDTRVLKQVLNDYDQET